MEVKELVAAIDTVNRNLKEVREAGEKQEAALAKFGQNDATAKEKMVKIEADIADALKAIGDFKKEALLAAEGRKAEEEASGKVYLNDEERGAKGALIHYLRKGDQRMTETQIKALSTLGNPEGGYLTTRDTSGRLVQMIHNSSPVRQYAGIQTISTDALEGIIDNDEADAGWTAEKKVRPETDTPQVGKWKIMVHERYANPKATQILLDDAAIDAEAWLMKKVADRFARQEAYAFVKGDGLVQPKGFMNQVFDLAPDATRKWGKIQYVKTGSNTGFIPTADATAVGGDCLIKLLTQLRPQYWAGAIWMMNRFTLGSIMQLKNAQGAYIWLPNFSQNAYGTLLNLPVDCSFDHMDDFGTQNNFGIAVGNLKEAYQIVDRQGVRILRDPYSSKPFVQFYTTGRVGGDVLNFEAIKVLKTSA